VLYPLLGAEQGRIGRRESKAEAAGAGEFVWREVLTLCNFRGTVIPRRQRSTFGPLVREARLLGRG